MVICINGLSFSYGDKKVFDKLTLEIDGSVCIHGDSGSGKTTLMRILAGLEKPQGGTITGVPDKIAYMFQEDRLLPWHTALENVAAVLPKGRQREAEERLIQVELGDKLTSFPGELSGGQQRRVAFARALAYDSGLLILDEPFKGLDESLTERMAKLLLSSGRRFIASVHARREIELLKCKTIEI